MLPSLVFLQYMGILYNLPDQSAPCLALERSSTSSQLLEQWVAMEHMIFLASWLALCLYLLIKKVRLSENWMELVKYQKSKVYGISFKKKFRSAKKLGKNIVAALAFQATVISVSVAALLLMRSDGRGISLTLIIVAGLTQMIQVLHTHYFPRVVPDKRIRQHAVVSPGLMILGGILLPVLSWVFIDKFDPKSTNSLWLVVASFLSLFYLLVQL